MFSFLFHYFFLIFCSYIFVIFILFIIFSVTMSGNFAAISASQNRHFDDYILLNTIVEGSFAVKVLIRPSSSEDLKEVYGLKGLSYPNVTGTFSNLGFFTLCLCLPT